MTAKPKFKFSETNRFRSKIFQGICVPPGREPIGFNVELREFHSVDSWSEYVILQIELRGGGGVIDCLDVLDEVISLHAIPVWGPQTVDFRPYGFYEPFRHLSIQIYEVWPRSIVKLYSILLKAYEDPCVRKTLSSITSELSKEEIENLINDITARVSKETGCQYLLKLFDVKDSLTHEDIEYKLRYLSELIHCLHNIEVYTVCGGMYTNIARKLMNNLRIVKEVAARQTNSLISKLREVLSVN